MDHYPRLVVLAALAACSPAFAFYQTVTPPAGYDSVLKTYMRQPGEQAFMNGLRGTATATANVAGKAVPMAVAYKFAPTAARVAAAAVFGNPALFVGALAVGAAYEWYKTSNYEVVDGVWKEKKTHLVPKSVYCYSGNAGKKCDVSRMAAAALAWPGACYVFTYSSPWLTVKGCDGYGRPGYGSPMSVGDTIETQQVQETYYDALTRPQFEDGMAPKSVPPDVIENFPLPLPWPVEKPILNPTPETSDPLPVPLPQPLRVPSGDPVKQGTVPETYVTPVVDLVPSPTVSDPWRVDQQTKDLTSLSPVPLDIAPVPVTPPVGDSTKESTDTPGLCDLYPDILACAKVDLGSLDPDVVPNTNVNVSISPMAGFGADNASCPASKSFTVQGRSFNMPFTLICDYASGLRPLIIAFAWLGAALMLIAAGRRNG